MMNKMKIFKLFQIKKNMIANQSSFQNNTSYYYHFGNMHYNNANNYY